MKLIVFGATGRTGRHVLAEGGRRGHQMTAFTRRPQGLDDHGDHAAPAAVVHGDARDPDAVRKAIDGADAVISTIAGAVRNDPHRLADTARVIAQAMADLGVRRLVVTSAYPIIVEDPPLAMAVLRRLLAASYADGAEMERIVAGSGLDWTIARLNRLTNKPATGRVHTSRGLPARPRAIARADVAALLLDIVDDLTLAGTAINVAGG
jgi:putative NADH-flavin reductase